MPGILPMKVIKVGSAAQSRIAQACDRCRSKKIRCDGIRPCCSQCASVGFECKTTDKLSRRAFPRGYTESLEERVRVLEGEVRELKDLLDEKDEKIDMLSKMHSNRRPSMTSSVSTPSGESRKEFISAAKDDSFRVQASPLLLESEISDSIFVGPSSGRTFIDAFKSKIQESGKSLAGLDMEAFLNVQRESTPSSLVSTTGTLTAPPRIFTDRCVNAFFQEWAPLFPVLHKPTFLRLYEDFVSTPEQVTDPLELAQLHLVFAIAGLSSDLPDRQQIIVSETQWRTSLDTIIIDNNIGTLQCLILALIYCISKADYSHLQHYKGIAVGLSHRLGLHQSQKRFSFGALTIETRKKVFWTLYTVDCFSAALLGLPTMLKDEDIHAEYPSDTDDEYVTEKGFQPTLPGEYTKISSGLALFRASRILSKVLGQNYPAAASYEVSLQSIASLETELNDWSDNLPTHLKLTFVQDKPSTDITGSRSALLSLAYYYIRCLIHRPAVGSSLGDKSSSSVIALADSSKHIIQIAQLLQERSMSFSFCLNKNELLTLSGLSLLYQGLNLKQEGKLMQDGLRLIATVAAFLEKSEYPRATDFKRLAAAMICLDRQSKVTSGRSPDNTMPAPTRGKSTSSSSVSRKQGQPQIDRHGHGSVSDSDPSKKGKVRRTTLPIIAMQYPNNGLLKGRASTDSRLPESPVYQHEYVDSPTQLPLKAGTAKYGKPPNLDYLPLNDTTMQPQSQPPSPDQSRSNQANLGYHTPLHPSIAYTHSKTAGLTSTEWETLLGSLDGAQNGNLYDAIYGGTYPALSLKDTSTSNYDEWTPAWDMSSLTDFVNDTHAAQSVLSFSEESLSSGEDLSASELGICGGQRDYGHALLTSSVSSADEFLFDGLNGTFGL